MKSLLLSILTLLSLTSINPSAWAFGRIDYERIQCPRVPAAFNELTTSLTGLKQLIETSERCSGVGKNIDELMDTITSDDYKKFTEITLGNKDKVLSPQDSQFVKNYAEKTTSSALGLIQLINNSDQCFPEQQNKEKALNTVSSMIFQTSKLVSSVAGPYGVPIGIAGSLVSGLIGGISKAYSHRSGFRFDDNSSRRNYVEVLCSYTDLKSQIQDIVDPEPRMNGLYELRIHLLSEIRSYELLEDASGDDFSANLEELQAKLGWVNQELDRMQDLLDQTTLSIGPLELAQMELEMDAFLFEREAQRFVSHLYETTNRSWQIYENDLNRWSKTYVRQIKSSGVSVSSVSGEASYNYATVGKFILDNVRTLSSGSALAEKGIESVVQSHMRKSKIQLRLVTASTQSMNEYCEFFSDILIISPSIYRSCEAGRWKDVEAKVEQIQLAMEQKTAADMASSVAAHAPRFSNWRESMRNRIAVESRSRAARDAQVLDDKD